MKTTALITLALVLMAPLTASAAPLMYVPTGEANEVLAIDLRTDAITARIGELENAHGLAGNLNSDYLVAGSMFQPGSADVQQPAKPAAVSEAEHAAHHSRAAKKNTPAAPSYVSIIDRRQGRVIRRIEVRGPTHHTAVSPDGKTAIAVHSGGGGISVIDLDKMNIVKSVHTGGRPNFAVFSPDGKQLYVSNAQPGTVSVIDTRDWSVSRNIKVGGEPEHLAASAHGERLFAVDVAGGKVVEVDVENATIGKYYAVGTAPHGIAVSADGRWLFVTSKGDGKLIRIDLRNGERRTVDLHPAPYHLAYAETVGKLYISSRMEPKIWVVDPQSMTVLGEIDIGRGIAHQMVILSD